MALAAGKYQLKKPPLTTVDAAGNDLRVASILRRIERAEIDRNRHLSRLEDINKFAMPWRHKPNQAQPSNQQDEIFDESIQIILEDFAADMLSTFTPIKADWLEVRPVSYLDAGAKRQIANALAEFQATIFAEMARSNLYQALQEAYLDLGPGTMALVINDISPAKPIHCEAVAVPDLLIDRGPYGFVDGRWRRRQMRGEDIRAVWEEADLSHWQGGEDFSDHDTIDGLWRDIARRDAEVWHYIVMVDGKIVLEETYMGQGSCPMVVARWTRDATTAWGMGPTYKVLPAIKTLNHVRYTMLKLFDKTVDPITSVEDDGVYNQDHGLNPGDWVPRAPGSEAPEVIESKGRFDVAGFELDELRSIIRRAHYQDEPDQLGKTPPSATQWADEAARRQRRMGTPATNLVQELLYPTFHRFAYLLARRGILPKVELNGREISLEPVSPLLRAQEMEEVTRVDRWAELLVKNLGPEMANVVMNGIEYASYTAGRMGVPGKLVRSQEEIAQAIRQVSQLSGGGGEAPGGEAP